MPRSRKHLKICACGCGQFCKDPRSSYIYEHIPLETRQAWGRDGRERGIRISLFRRFKADVDRVIASGRVNREDLIAAFALVYDRGYQSGYKVALRRTSRPSIADDITARLAHGPKHRRELGANVMAVARALSRLRAEGVVEPSARGVWALTKAETKAA